MADEQGIEQQLAALLAASGEQDIRRRLAELLETLESGEYRLEVRAGTGSADLVCHEYRVVIETKQRGGADPDAAGAGPNETQRDQVARYVEALAEGHQESGDARPWRGFLTDGQTWWGWEWIARSALASPEGGRFVALPQVQGIDPTAGADQFRQFATEHLAPPNRKGIPAPPSPLRPVFESFLTELRDLLPDVETAPFFETKFGLWRRTMQGSGLAGSGEIGQRHLFAEHTLLVVAARMIALASVDGTRTTDLPEVVGEGFTAWLSDFPEGVNLLERVGSRVAGYDWRAADRDMLKELYHDLIDKEHRKEFGEYYTPDWLAEDVVERTLLRDPSRLDSAIKAAAVALDSEGPHAAPYEVLDPACGSGTFLFWAARAIARRIRSAHPLLSEQTRELVSSMVVGMDVHPVAVEMARATLATALPAGASVPLRVFLADSLLPTAQAQATLAGTVGISSVGGQQIDIPAEVIESPRAAELVDTLVGAAVGEVELKEVDSDTQKLLGGAVTQLSETVELEGDHVWKWYIGNQIAPAALARRKVAAIVANPPWLVVNDTPEGSRKEGIKRFKEQYGLKPKASWSAKGDLAALFSARAVDVYLADDGAFGLVLPGSALINQTWAPWRSGAWGEARVGFTGWANLDAIDPPPFAHAPNGTCMVFGARDATGKPNWDDAESLIYSGDPQAPNVAVAQQRPSRPSPYAGRFRHGVAAQPLGLCLVVGQLPAAENGVIHITTMASRKGKWKGVQHSGQVEAEVLHRTLRAQGLRPFVCQPEAWYVAPLTADRARVLELDEPEFVQRFPRAHEFWAGAEEKYALGRAETAGATLSKNVDHWRTLTTQAVATSEAKRKVVYNKSAGPLGSLRSGRIPENVLVVETCYWHVAASEEEALYLIGVLNAECLQDAWRESKTSKMHYDTNPMKHVPVPSFDPTSKLHSQIVTLAAAAEDNPDAPRDGLERAVADLLPDYALA